MSFGVALLRISLSVVLGGLIGFERQLKHRPAGFRTHILVCLGSTLVMITSEYICLKYFMLYNIVVDPTRLGAQVISGIGFLGAGTIIYSESKIKGLTTAASLWAVACVGLTIGIGFYSIAVVSSIMIYIILFLLNRIAYRINENVFANILITFENHSKTLGEIILMLNEINVKIVELSIIETADCDNEKKVKISITISRKIDINVVLNAIRSINGILSAEKCREYNVKK